MAVKYKNYTPGTYKESKDVKDAKETADYWNNQELKNFNYADFKNSKQTLDFLNQLNSLKAPGEFNFSQQKGMNDLFNRIMNRENFSYDVNGDALYQQYKDQFVNLGKMASADVMGQAAAMTGGYGNSYAQSVGQQAYQGYLQQLNDKVPELYQLALSKYQMEGDEMYNQYGLYSDLYNKEYGQHRDAVGDYQTDRGYLADMWANSHGMDMDIYTANRDTALAELESRNNNIAANRSYYMDVYNNLRNTEYGQYMDNETLKKLAIDVANANLAQQESDRISNAQLLLDQGANRRANEEWNQKKSVNNSINGTGVGIFDTINNATGNDTGDKKGWFGTQFALSKITTYEKAKSYIESNGGSTNGLITAEEFNSSKKVDGKVTIGGKSYSSYAEYLKDYCAYATS